MSYVVYKYSLESDAVQLELPAIELELPEGAEILSARVQNDRMYVWVKHIKGASSFDVRVIHVYGTGHPIDNRLKLKFIDTVFMNGGSLVWHVFEVI